MDIFQHLLVYVTVALALGYVLKKYAFPNAFSSQKSKEKKSCGSSDCGCSS